MSTKPHLKIACGTKVTQTVLSVGLFCSPDIEVLDGINVAVEVFETDDEC